MKTNAVTMKKSHAETQRRRGKHQQLQSANCKLQNRKLTIRILQFEFCNLSLCVAASLRKIFFVLLLMFPVASLRSENWDRFRGPNGGGQSDSTTIPSEWKPENFLWQKKLPGIGHSSPVIWDGKLFVTSALPATGEQIVQAYDARSGRLLWDRHVVAPAVSPYKHHNFNSLASSTPAVDSNNVYVAWLVGGKVMIAALRHNGDAAWQKEVGRYEEGHGFGSSPVVVDDMVCIALDNDGESCIVALDGQSGSERWRLPRAAGVTSFATPCLLDPAADQKLLLAVSTASGLTGVHAKTGKVAWQAFHDDLPQRCVGSPVAAGDIVFMSCGEGGGGEWLIAARSTGAHEAPEEVYRIEQNAPYVPTPVVIGNLLFIWHDRGTVSCHDVATGRQHWRERVGGDFHSSPIRIGDRILAASRGGEVVVLAAKTKFELLARNMLDEPCVATPAVADDQLYLRTESTLFCIGKPAGSAE
jgi:outer membrane protein assembly factor BamB